MNMGNFYRDYEDISKYVLGLMVQTSAVAARLNETALELQKNPVFHNNADFALFLKNLDTGRHYLSRSQGSMETMVASNYYSGYAIYYWYNSLYKPALNAFSAMLTGFGDMEKEPAKVRESEFATLSQEVVDFRRALTQLDDGINEYSLE